MKNTALASRDSDKFMLRLPDGMRPEIAAQAKANGRSMNAEIVCRLQRSFEQNTESSNNHQLGNNLTFTDANIPPNWSPDFVEELREVLAFIRNCRGFTKLPTDISLDGRE